MSNKRYSGVEAALQERINGLVEEALASAEKPLNLSEIEDIALRVRARIGVEVTQALVAKQAPVGVPGPICEECGREMHYKGQKQRRVVSRSGEVEWERPYYYCQTCRRGLFPPR
jgi:hypothetical protein